MSEEKGKKGKKKIKKKTLFDWIQLVYHGIVIPSWS